MIDQLCVLFSPGEHSPDKVFASLKRLKVKLFIIYILPKNEQLKHIYKEWIPKLGDFQEVESIDKIFEAAMNRNKIFKVTGIVSFNENLISVAASIAFELNLPFNSPEVIEDIKNKYKQRTLLKENQVPIPKFRLIKSKKDLIQAENDIGFPAILKPIYGSGSYYVQRVRNSKELYNTYLLFQKKYVNFFENSSTKFFLLEEEMVGENYHEDLRYGDYGSVELVVFNKEINLLSITDNMPLKEPYRETGFLLPSILKPERKEQLYATSIKAVKALGITHGIFQVELKFTIHGPKIIEVNPRPGAGTPYRVNLADPFYDFFYEYAGMFLNKKPALPKWENFSGSYMVHSPNSPIIVDYINSNIINKDLYFQEVLAKKGDIIDPLEGAHNLLAYTYIKGMSHEDIFKQSYYFNEALNLKYHPNY